MDLNGFKVRKGWTQSDMGDALGVATSSVGGYCSGVRKPSYEVIESLFREGATIAEVFSPEIQDIVLRNSAHAATRIPEDVYSSQAFREGVEVVVRELVKKGVPVENIVTP